MIITDYLITDKNWKSFECVSEIISTHMIPFMSNSGKISNIVQESTATLVRGKGWAMGFDCKTAQRVHGNVLIMFV